MNDLYVAHKEAFKNILINCTHIGTASIQIHTVSIEWLGSQRLQTDGSLTSNKHSYKSIQSPAKLPPAAQQGHWTQNFTS